MVEVSPTGTPPKKEIGMQIIDTRVGDYGGQEPLSDDEIGVRVGDIKVLADKASF